jgi:chorismate mutase/prephenate dehydratase
MPESIPNKPGPNADENISALRLSIDEIDEQILDLINRRLLLAEQIGGFKKLGGIQIADPGREKQIIDRLQERNIGPLGGDCLRHIFTLIIAEGRNIQKSDQK